MTEDNLVTVIVPIYNVEPFLSQCINSIISQNYSNLEIILVDDGSPDGCEKICDEFKARDSRIKVVHKQNGGVSSARNAGLAIATGTYICFVDPDDYLMKDYVGYLLELCCRYNADISITDSFYSTYISETINNSNIELLTKEDALCSILLYKIQIGVYCKMFRKDFIDSNKIRFDENIFMGEGFNFNTYCFQRANMIVQGHKQVYFYRRNNPNSATTVFSNKKWDNGIYAINNIKKNMIINTRKTYLSWKFAFWHTICDAFNYMYLCNAKKSDIKRYKYYKKIARTKALISFKVDTNRREKIKGFLYFFFPTLVPFLIKKRNGKY